MFGRKNLKNVNVENANIEAMTINGPVVPTKEQMVVDIERQVVLGAAGAVGGLAVTLVAKAIGSAAKCITRKIKGNRNKTQVPVTNISEKV